MTKLPRQSFTKKFRDQAARLVTEDGLSVAEAAKQLGISERTLGNWVRLAKKHGTPQGPGKHRPVSDLEAEVAKLRRELAVSQMECDILKKAAAYFARESLPGTRS